MTDTGDRTYTFGPAEGLDVDPRLVDLSRDRPVLRVRLPHGEGEAWLATRHADVKTVLGDPRFSRAAASGRDVPRAIAVELPPTTMLSMDPPRHGRLRRPVATAFTPRRVEALRPRARRVADDLLDAAVAGGPPADLARTLTWPLPITVMSELLGVPVADREPFTAWVDQLLVLSDPDRARSAREHLDDYLRGLVALRRTHPTEDLLGDLVATQGAAQDPLDDDELVSLADSLLSAGYEATASQLGNFVYTLLTNPGTWRELVADPTLVPAAVEELSRIVPSSASAGFTRIALADVELGGQVVRAGEAVVVEYAMANRDPAVFDRPTEIDFHREANPHLAFGYGAHFCLGAQLARMLLGTVLETLVRRLPGLRLAVPADQVPWRAERLIRGVAALPVTW